MTSWAAKLAVSDSSGQILEADLGHDAVRVLAGSLADDIINIDLCSALAFHPSATVRAEIARRDHLHAEAVDHLLADKTPAVRQAIHQSTAARQRISFDWVRSALEQDVTLAEDIIGSIDFFPELDASEVLGHCAGHPDPAVRMAVARSRDGGRPLLRRLSTDTDPDVRTAAGETLRDW